MHTLEGGERGLREAEAHYYQMQALRYLLMGPTVWALAVLGGIESEHLYFYDQVHLYLCHQG